MLLAACGSEEPSVENPPETPPVRVDIIAPPTARLAEPERVVEWIEYGASEQGTPGMVSMVTDGKYSYAL